MSPGELNFLTAVNRWLPDASRSMVVPMRERSWQLVGNDKVLEEMRSGRLFEPGRLGLDILRCRPAWPPVQQRVFGGGRWLVVESWSTFESLCSVATLAGFDGRIIFRAGAQVGTRVLALADAGDVPEKPVLYFGDLDAGGLRAARLAAGVAQSAGWPAVVPCRELYELTLASEHRLPQPPASAELAGWVEQWFGGHLGERARTALVSGLIVRQEAVGLEQLSGRHLLTLLNEQPRPAADTRVTAP